MYAQIFETFDFDATPIAPPVNKAFHKKKLNQHATWSKHGVSGWHIDPALKHYRC